MPARRILLPAEMAKADRLTIASGLHSGMALMERAAHAVVDTILSRHPECRRAVILCGPGNNGGDGHVIARLLEARGVPVEVHADRLPASGTDAAVAAKLRGGHVAPMADLALGEGDLVVDALYGTGLTRPLADGDAVTAEQVNRSGVPVVAVDVPSGLDGRGQAPTGPVIRAGCTVTFAALKPAHLLAPGPSLCGEVILADIGIPDRIMRGCAGNLFLCEPALFADALPSFSPSTHKYARGSLMVTSGPAGKTGAARLAAAAGARVAGAVTILAPEDAVAEISAHCTSTMIAAESHSATLAARRVDASVIGPGNGVGERLAGLMADALAAEADALVLDADALTTMAAAPDLWFGRIRASGKTVVLTPHDGEFRRLFVDIAVDPSLSKLDRARQAAAQSGATILYKGADTVIAAPDGRAAISIHGTADLASAGSGDVLAGLIGGLLACAMTPFEAACAGAWLHAQAGRLAGAGLVAEDLVAQLPAAISVARG